MKSFVVNCFLVIVIFLELLVEPPLTPSCALYAPVWIHTNMFLRISLQFVLYKVNFKACDQFSLYWAPFPVYCRVDFFASGRILVLEGRFTNMNEFFLFFSSL